MVCPWEGLIQTQWGGQKEKACCDAFVCEQRKSPHYTNLFSLVDSQDNLESSEFLQSTQGKRSQILFSFMLNNVGIQ